MKRKHSADSMPEDAWEQREDMRKVLLEYIEKLYSIQLYPNLTINALMLATLSFFYRECEDNEIFRQVVEEYTENMRESADKWVKDAEELEEEDQEWIDFDNE